MMGVFVEQPQASPGSAKYDIPGINWPKVYKRGADVSAGET